MKFARERAEELRQENAIAGVEASDEATERTRELDTFECSVDFKPLVLGEGYQYLLMPSAKKPSCTLGRLVRWDDDKQPKLTIEAICKSEAHVKPRKFDVMELQTTIGVMGWKKVSDVTEYANHDQRLLQYILSLGSKYEREVGFQIKLHQQMQKTEATLLELLCLPVHDYEKDQAKTAKKKKLNSGKRVEATCTGCGTCTCGFETAWRTIVEHQGTHKPDDLLELLIKWCQKKRSRGNWLYVIGVGGSGKSYCFTDALTAVLGEYAFVTPTSTRGAYPQEPLDTRSIAAAPEQQ